jgi:phosphate transport system ATP-binding protein
MLPETKIEMRDVSFFYDQRCVLDHLWAEFSQQAITAIVGPSGHGKSTLLTTLNRLWHETGGARLEGKITICLEGRPLDLYADTYDLPWLRRKVGMVFQAPNPLPMSIYKNIAFPLKLNGYRKETFPEKVERALKQAYLWDDVKDRLNEDARTLSGGQQQRLCFARALILSPEVLLLDEPTASLDAHAGAVIEDLLVSLKTHCTLLMVTHYMDQVKRVADHVMRLENGRLSPC